MSQDSSPEQALEISTEDLPAPSTGISRADTLPDIEESHAQGLCKLQVSDGDFHTHAKVCSESFLSRIMILQRLNCSFR